MMPDVIEPKENSTETPVAVPKEVRDRVTVGPAGGWVKVREVDESFRHAASYSGLLSDQQHHALRHEDYYREVQRLETRQALDVLGQWRLDFDPRTQRVVIHSLQVRREGSATDHAQVDQFRFLQRETGLKSRIIDGRITVLVLLEDVRVGDVIDASYTIHTTPDLLEDRFWTYTTLPDRVALRAFHLSVRFPADRAMQWKSNDKSFAPAISEVDGETEWSWKKENLLPEERESNMPAWHFHGTWLQVTDCASWGEIATAAGAAWREDMDAPELSRMVEEINAAAATPLERIDRAVTMVQDDIRYLSVNEDLGGFIPSPPSAVLRRRYGDCKDKSFLLSHLLRLLGVKAWPVLVNTYLRRTVEDLLPMPGAFNHAIVKYEIDGQIRWVDATMSLQGGGALARLVPDYRAGLPVGPDIAGLDKIPPLPTKNERYELRETFSLDSRPAHASILNVSIKAGGWKAESLRREFANVGEAGMAKKREQFYKPLFPELKRVGELKWEDDRVLNECRLAESYDILNPGKFTPDGRACVFHYHSHYIQWLLDIAQAGKRKHPYLLTFPCNVEHIIEVETTGILNENKVTPMTHQGTTFRFTSEPRRRGNRAVMHYSLKTLVGVIPPQQFEAHRKMVAKIMPATTFYFRFPRGMPAPQKRPAGLGKTAPVAASAPVQAPLPLNKPVKKFQLLSEEEHRGSRRKRRTTGSNREEQEPGGEVPKRTLLIGLCVVGVVAVIWLLWVFFMVKG
ncbi:MAG: DUF3857 domain-containing protein [Chthoniobacteraceae bacterium]